MTALEIEQRFVYSGMDFDGDVIGIYSDRMQQPDLMYSVNLRDNIFIKYIMDVPQSDSLDGTR